MKIYGEFEIHDTFKLSNQGIILIGKIIVEKKPIIIEKNDKISFEYDNEILIRRIKGYEFSFGRNIKTELHHMQNLGVLIECVNDDEIENLNNWKPKKIIGKLISSDD